MRDVLTLEEVAEYLRVHPTTIYRLLKKQQIPAFKVGSDWPFSLASVDRWRTALENADSPRAPHRRLSQKERVAPARRSSRCSRAAMRVAFRVSSSKGGTSSRLSDEEFGSRGFIQSSAPDHAPTNG